MPTLLEKIEANAAKRLELPPNRRPSEELARYKDFMRLEGHRLKMLHRAGGSGLEVSHAHAAVIDVLLRYIFKGVTQQQLTTAGRPQRRLALVAIGGYGRGELNPCSDIDIMFLHDGEFIALGKTDPTLTERTEGLLHTLWDIGLRVGHSVRSVEDCVTIANSDMKSKTSLIEARLISGDRGLFEKMQQLVLAKCVRDHEDEYILARVEDQAARRARFGGSACMQEPNIKNGCGGLRDYQNLLWMAFFKYRTRTLTDLEVRGLINESERKQLHAAYDFLLRVRNDLHYEAGRAADVVLRSLQPQLAHNLGYPQKSMVERLEKFMRDLYSHQRNIYLITRTMEHRLALLPQPGRRMPSLRALLRRGRHRVRQQILDGFKFVDGEIYPDSSRVFRDQPRRLMRVFLHAQQRALKLNPDLAQLVRNQLSLIDRSFLRDPHVQQTFLEILNQRGNVAPILRAMHEVGLLGKYLPEFGKLTCLVQHEFYHQYPADEHTLICLGKLDQVWEAQQSPFSHYSEMFQRLERPFILYLALLLHDSGKACHTGRHAEIGGQLALTVARRIALDGATAHTLRLIIENHLLMAKISQRRDLDDPSVIRNFAAQVQNPETLTMLTLHTFADSQGTSDQLWNDFKDSLLRTLFRKASQVLAGGTEFIRAEEKQRELLAQEVRKLLPPTFGEAELQAHFSTLPPRYFQIHSAKQIQADLALAHRFMQLQLTEADRALEPIITWHNEPDRGYTAVSICTWDRDGLFSKIAGSLTAAALNILSAQIFSRGDGIILDTFFVNTSPTGALPKGGEREKFEKLLHAALTGEVDLAALIPRKKPERNRQHSLEDGRLPTVIRFDNRTSEDRTVIDVETDDQLGVLYVISQALTELDLNIYVAKISTEKGAAVDSFYVGEANGAKIVDPDRQAFVERRLLAAIASLDSAAWGKQPP